MRLPWIALVVLLACGDPFADAQKTDTIESYEAYLTANPEGRYRLEADSRLRTLYLDKARAEATLEAYDAWLARFPEGPLREKVLTEREQFLYDWALKTNTAEGWKKFVDEYPKAAKDRLTTAERRIAVIEYLPSLELSEPRVTPINLARDPKGELNGYSFQVDVTNKGSKVLEQLWLTVEYLNDEGRAVGQKEWPVVAPRFPTPVVEEKLVPMKPGELRTWEWTTGGIPETWNKQVRVTATRIKAIAP